MGRSEELDAMSEADKKTDILERLKQHGAITISNRYQLAFWGGAINRLKEAGKVETTFTELYEEQYSYLRVTLCE